MRTLSLETGAGYISCLDHCYPSEAFLLSGDMEFQIPAHSTVYGYVIDGEIAILDRTHYKNDYFSISSMNRNVEKIDVQGDVAFFVRHGFLGQTVSGYLEDVGRVCYIDGCTDSVLVCPPRLGDPCLNSLHFRRGIDQTFHTHPSIRLGVVAKGSGISSLDDKEIKLKTGMVFALDAHEIHRFRTPSEEMIIVAYHPDSDWGPTDEVHPMLNRTYINK